MKPLKNLLAFLLLGAVFNLSAHAAPTLTTQPAATQTVDKGATVTLSVAATGTGSLSYQWVKDGVDLPGKTDAALSLSNVQPPHIGYYTCRVTDSTGSTTSQQATLNLTGENFGIWQGLVGYYPLHGNFTDLSYAQNHLIDDGQGFLNSQASNGAIIPCLQVGAQRVLTSQKNVGIGGNASRTVSVWIKPFVLPTEIGQTAKFVFWGLPANASREQVVAYHVSIPDGVHYLICDWSSQQARIDPELVINNWNHLLVVYDGDIYGTKFFLNGQLATGGFAVGNFVGSRSVNTLDSPIGVSGAEGFISDVRIYNRALSAEEVSQLYQLEAGASPEITVQPESQSVYFNQTASFSVTATGSGPLAYQWFRDGRAIAGATSATYSVKATPAARGAYSVRVSNTLGSVTSDAVSLDAAAARYIWADGSDNQRVAPGEAAGFGVENVTGPAGAVSYQWFKDGRAVPGATSAALGFDSVTAAQAGRYTLVITTAAGKETTAVRVLGVEDPGLLIYSYGATVTEADPVGEVTVKQMGYLLVDRANGQGALVLYGKNGLLKVQSVEGPFPLESTSTGPLPGSRTVFHAAVSDGEGASEQIWLTGRDALVRLSASRSTIAPSVATGSRGRIAAGSGIGHSSVTLALSTGQTLAARTNAEDLAEAVSRIQAELTAKGYLVQPE